MHSVQMTYFGWSTGKQLPLGLKPLINDVGSHITPQAMTYTMQGQLWQHRDKEYSINIAQKFIEIILIQLSDFRTNIVFASLFPMTQECT